MIVDGLRTQTAKAVGVAQNGAGKMAIGARSASRKARDTADDRVHGIISLLPVARAQAEEVAEHIPEVVDQVRAGAFETKRTFDAMPDPTLKELAAGSLGLAAGLYVAGAPRLLVLAAATPGHPGSGCDGHSAARRSPALKPEPGRKAGALPSKKDPLEQRAGLVCAACWSVDGPELTRR